MNPGPTSPPPDAARRFRRRLLLAIMALVAGLTVAALLVARRSIAADTERAYEQAFSGALATLHEVQELRHAALVERCRALARKARIRAALEDEALDLLYLSAGDELRDAILPLTAVEDAPAPADSLRARFYRFLDATGQVLPPPAEDATAGELPPAAAAQLALPRLGLQPQTGYITGGSPPGPVSEVIATPIVSSETGAPIAALVLGFEPVRLALDDRSLPPFASGLWLDQGLAIEGLDAAARATLLAELQRRADEDESPDALREGRFPVVLAGEAQLAFFKQLNPGSLFPPAFEICLFPLAAMEARQQRATAQIAGVGGILLLAGFLVSLQLAGRFARPVAVLAHDSAEQRAQRRRAEAALETTSAELERVARFSADASHQLKTPVTVLRAGLEEMLARGSVPPSEFEEVSALIHQTYRLSTLIEDLLLLSRLDAGQLKIQFGVVDLGSLIAASLDDLSASPDALELTIEAEHPPQLTIAGEKKFIALVLLNLLENARKYNQPGGRIRIDARAENGAAVVTIANTSPRPIPPAVQPHIFERFHRGTIGENIPGYGIGLNLARELTRLHDGELRLLRSDEAWTEFELRFHTLPPAPEN